MRAPIASRLLRAPSRTESRSIDSCSLPSFLYKLGLIVQVDDENVEIPVIVIVGDGGSTGGLARQ